MNLLWGVSHSKLLLLAIGPDPGFFFDQPIQLVSSLVVKGFITLSIRLIHGNTHIPDSFPDIINFFGLFVIEILN